MYPAPRLAGAQGVRATAHDRQIEHRLAEHGVRYTRGRRRVVAALAGTDGPRSAAELHRRLRGAVPLSSLYRSLTVLESTGVLAPHHGARGVTRYELAEWLGGHHHHLVCTECGSIADVRVAGPSEQALRAVIATLANGEGFEASDHSLEIEGRCSRCR